MKVLEGGFYNGETVETPYESFQKPWTTMSGWLKQAGHRLTPISEQEIVRHTQRLKQEGKLYTLCEVDIKLDKAKPKKAATADQRHPHHLEEMHARKQAESLLTSTSLAGVTSHGRAPSQKRPSKCSLCKSLDHKSNQCRRGQNVLRKVGAGAATASTTIEMPLASIEDSESDDSESDDDRDDSESDDDKDGSGSNASGAAVALTSIQEGGEGGSTKAVGAATGGSSIEEPLTSIQEGGEGGGKEAVGAATGGSSSAAAAPSIAGIEALQEEAARVQRITDNLAALAPAMPELDLWAERTAREIHFFANAVLQRVNRIWHHVDVLLRPSSLPFGSAASTLESLYTDARHLNLRVGGLFISELLAHPVLCNVNGGVFEPTVRGAILLKLAKVHESGAAALRAIYGALPDFFACYAHMSQDIQRGRAAQSMPPADITPLPLPPPGLAPDSQILEDQHLFERAVAHDLHAKGLQVGLGTYMILPVIAQYAKSDGIIHHLLRANTFLSASATPGTSCRSRPLIVRLSDGRYAMGTVSLVHHRGKLRPLETKQMHTAKQVGAVSEQTMLLGLEGAPKPCIFPLLPDALADKPMNISLATTNLVDDAASLDAPYKWAFLVAASQE